jgi:heat shock protein HslJ
MKRWSAGLALVLAAVRPALAVDPPLVCFGNEPSWSLALETPGEARLALPDETPVEYRGSATGIEHLRERVWRGHPAGAAGSDLVAFLREAACSDGMSDVVHPVVARVSLPDGRFLAGCCRITAAGAAPPAGGSAIEGTVWRLVGLSGLDPAALADASTVPTLRFEAGRVEGFGGCNRLAGGYAIDGDHVKLGPLAGTMMACPGPASEVEAAFTRALAGTLLFHVAEERLTLAPESDADAKLVFVAAPAPRLEGVTWEVILFNNGRHAVVGLRTDTRLTVSFQDGVAAGHAGCNGFRASYTLEGASLAVGPAAATRKFCAGEGIMEQEREFLAALESATTWAIDARGTLDLHRADGERALMAREGAPEPAR